MADVLIQIVDEHDNPIGGATKHDAWKKGLYRRVVRIMLEDGKGNVLLQRRDGTKQPFPGRWDSSAAGHVDAGETYEQAARRELAEEIGLKDVALEEIGYFSTRHTYEWRKLRSWVKMYRAVIKDLPTALEAGEVSEVRWFAIGDVKKMAANQPGQMTDGCRYVVERYYL